MNQPFLSILIPTVYGRERQFNNLAETLKSQIQGLYKKGDIQSFDDIEIISEIDDKKITIGEKRESLYRKATGLYSLQIDDDDSLSSDALKLIMEAISQLPDCITYLERCYMNGKVYTCKHSLEYDDWHDNYDGFDFVRTPFYKDVIRTVIAKSVPFEHIRYGEDHAWSRELKPHLKSEIHIPQEVYYYIHNSKPEDFNERYGFNHNQTTNH